MRQDEIKALFDRQAASYDTQWAKPHRSETACISFLGRCSLNYPQMQTSYALG